MSLQRLKVAFNDACRRSAGAVTWDAFLAALVSEAGGITLHTFVPSEVPQDRVAQLELFAGTDSVRCIARATGIPKSTVHDWLSARRTDVRTRA